MSFQPISPKKVTYNLGAVIDDFQGFKKVHSLIDSAFTQIVLPQDGLYKKVLAVGISALSALAIALSSIPLTLHLAIKVIQSKSFSRQSLSDHAIGKLSAVAMLPGIAVAFVLFSMKELIQQTHAIIQGKSYPDHIYEEHNPLNSPVIES